MRQIFLLFIILIILCAYPSLSQGLGNVSFEKYGIYDTDNIKPEEYHQRREAAIVKMDSGSVAVFRANDSDNRNGDVDYRFRQNDNFLYLTGCNAPNSTLILLHEGMQVDSIMSAKEILFVRDRARGWKGYNTGVEGAKEVLGFGIEGTSSISLSADRLKEFLPQILSSKKTLYYTPSIPDIYFEPVSEKKLVTQRELEKDLGEKYPNLTIKSPNPLLSDLRVIKSPAELMLIQKAINATSKGCIEAMKRCRPEMYEYQLQAVIEYCFTQNGCEFYSFPSIIGSGPNALFFHYEANRRQMKNGDLVVMDIGAEYHGYSADITRTIPVNGKFSPAQKDIYDLVLYAQECAFKEIRPDVMMNASSKKALEVIAEGLVTLGIIKDNTEARKYCPHGTSHFIGLNVHDVGSKGKLVPGMVFTMEPGIYIPDSSDCDEKYRGIGIRIEDDVLVTENGCEILSKAAPKTVIDIEKLMKK
jgi:Xaa-Pro aminopeptidase